MKLTPVVPTARVVSVGWRPATEFLLIEPYDELRSRVPLDPTLPNRKIAN